MFEELRNRAHAWRNRQVHRKFFERSRREFHAKLYRSGDKIRLLSGSFAGMQYLNTSSFGPLAPKWLGSYEWEIQDLVRGFCTSEYDLVMFSPLHDSQRILCTRVGIDPKKIVPLEKVPHVESEELFFVTPPWHYGATYLKMARAFNLGLSSPSSVAPMKRIYVSRERCTHGKITNEGQLMAELTRLDFEKVTPDMLNFDDQVALFGQAEVVIGAHGAGLTDLILSKPGCKVVEIRNPKFDASETYQARGGNIFWRFCQFLGFDYYPFFARADQTCHRAPEGQVVEPVRLPNLTVDINRFMQLLRPILDGS
jgi:hypothetical protein